MAKTRTRIQSTNKYNFKDTTPFLLLKHTLYLSLVVYLHL
jgi:hypothetical protein